MEDRWFIFLEDATLFFHRSWSGFCIVQVRLAPVGASYTIAEVLVNRDPSQYSGGSATYDRQVLLFLIDNLLLGVSRPLPLHPGVPAGIATDLYVHHVAGAGHKAPTVITLNDLWRWFWAWLWWLVKPR